jgi:epoxyqueuosine reductase
MEDGLIRQVRASLEAGGFPLTGTASPGLPDQDLRALHRWLAQGLQGPLGYMSRTGELREDTKALEPWVRGLFCAAMPYNTSRALSAQSIASGRAWVSRYAWGRDYHKVLRSRLRPAARLLEAKGFKARICVDSAPLLERAYAAKAGFGFIGKNGCLVHPDWGSYLFLGEILTDLELPDAEPVSDGCGDCALCLRGCPTRAFAAPRILDAGRCLSTWTIEHRGPFPENAPPLHGHLFGCDRCQEVCPYNRRASLSGEADFRPRPQWVAPDPADVASMEEARWDEATRGMALRRARHDGVVRNARRILEENAARRTSE